MKRSKQQLIGRLAAALLAGVAIVSCSQDDGSELSGGTLPTGEYPLELTATVEGMTTRTSGKDAWTGDGTEYIGVRMVTGETTTESKYVIGNTAGTSVQPADDSETLYWQNSDPVTITSWYPYEAQTDVDITDQSSGFAAFDYLTATAEDIPYGNTVELKFKHQMAKVSYTLTAGDGISSDDLSNATVLFAGYTTASFSEGALTTSETENGWITPTTDKDVLLVPQDMTDKQFIKISVNGSSYVFTPTTDTNANLQAGCHYTYNITVSKTGLEVTASSNIEWGSGTEASEAFYVSDGYTYSTDANGTRSYTVYNENGLNAWSKYTRSGYYDTNCTLAKDITLTSNWTAVGNSSSNSYIGTFDGNGYTITNLTISASRTNQGLIGYLGSDGEVKNLTLANVNITSSYDRVGAVVGYNVSGTITACFSTGTVTGSGNFKGGVVGENEGTVTACYSTGTVTGCSFVGGVVGDNFYGTVTACYSTGTVSGTSFVSSVVGDNVEGTIVACYYSSSTSDSNAIYVDDSSVTWAIAKDAMNEALTGTGWQYTGDGTGTPPLTLVAE